MNASILEHQSQALSREAVQKLSGTVVELAAKAQSLKILEARTSALVDAAGSGDALDRYESTLESHDAILERVSAFRRAATLTTDGLRRVVPRKGSGRLVTVTLQARRIDGTEDGHSLAARYFVHSSLPVYYHLGYGHTQLSEAKFEKVRSLAGADLFAQVADDEGTDEFAAFMSYDLRPRLARWGLCDVPLGLTLGTDFSEPGERLYGGVSLSLGRFILSGGLVSGSIAEGEGSTLETIVDQTGQVLGSRELFNSIRERREWKPFFAVTMKPF